MDDFRIYERALTDSEVTTLYGSGNGDFTLVRTGNQLSFKKQVRQISMRLRLGT